MKLYTILEHQLKKEPNFLTDNGELRKWVVLNKALSLTEQKQHLCVLLDKNQLVVNFISLNDADFAGSEEEKRVTKDFYGL